MWFFTVSAAGYLWVLISMSSCVSMELDTRIWINSNEQQGSEQLEAGK